MAGRPASKDRARARMERMTLAAKLLDMHARGWTYRRLANHFEMGVTTVADHIADALRAIPEPAVENYRKVMGEQVMDTIRAHRPSIKDAASAMVILHAVDRAMRLYGLAAPIQVEDVTPSDAARSALAAKLARLFEPGSEGDVPPEPDPGGI